MSRVHKWPLVCVLAACSPTTQGGRRVTGEAKRAPSASASAKATSTAASEGAVPELAASNEVEQMVVSGTGACLRWKTGRVRCFGTDAEVDDVDDAVDISSDGETTCVARAEGSVACWGFQAELDRDRPPSKIPVTIPRLKDVVDVELQYWGNSLSHPTLCVTTRAGEISCSCHSTRPCATRKVGVVTGAPPSKVAMGAREAGCALTRDQRVWCWNTWQGNVGGFVSGLRDVEQLVDYQGATCARLADERVMCWGSNHAGQLGRGYMTFVGDPTERPTDHEKPMAVGPKARFMAPGAILDEDGRLFVWGDNDKRQRYPGGGRELYKPTEYSAIGNLRLVAASSDRSCALDGEGRVKCWGAPPPLAPADAREIEKARDAVTIEAAGGHICALRKSGKVTCWGNRTPDSWEDDDELFEPRAIDVDDAVEIAVSRSSVCARSKDRRVRCWGESELDDGKPLPGLADAIGFAGRTLCLSDAKAMRCTSKLIGGSTMGILKQLAVLPPMGHSSQKSPPPAPRKKLHLAGPGASHGWASMSHRPCFVRNGGAFCADSKRLKAIPGVAGVKELGEDTILLTNGTVVSPRKPAVRVAEVPIRALSGEDNIGVGNDGRIYSWSYGGKGRTIPRKDLAAITDAIDMVGKGFPSTFGCVVRRSGKVSCWGSGARGEIGLGDRRHPREVGRIK